MAAAKSNQKKQSTRNNEGRIGVVGPSDQDSPFTYQTYVAEFGEPITLLRGIDDDIMTSDEEEVPGNVIEKESSIRTPLRPAPRRGSFSSFFEHSTTPLHHSPLTQFRHSSTPPLSTEVTPLFLGGRMVLSQRPEVTSGTWKVGLFGCFHEGLCHGTLWTALCCPTLTLGRILTRLDLDWLGNKNNQNEQETIPKPATYRIRSFSDTSPIFDSCKRNYHAHFFTDGGFAISNNVHPSLPSPSAVRYLGGGVTAFTQVFVMTCLFWTFLVIVLPPLPIPVQDPDTGVILALYFPNHVGTTTSTLQMQWIICALLVAVFGLYMVVMLTRVRQYIQTSRNILTTNRLVKNLGVSICCACCSLTQMAWETEVSDEEDQRGLCGDYCSSPTGLWLREHTIKHQLGSNSCIPRHHSNPQSTSTVQYYSNPTLSVTSLLQSASSQYYHTIGSSRERGLVPPPPSIRHLPWPSTTTTVPINGRASTGSFPTTAKNNTGSFPTTAKNNKIPRPPSSSFSGRHLGHPL